MANPAQKQTAPAIIELPEMHPHAGAGPAVLDARFSLFEGVKVRLTVVAGELEMTLGALMDLKESTVLKLERSVDAPVDVIVEGKVIARGQLVAVDDNFGVRIIDSAIGGQS
jgi:flagellar motor switch protein FliN/FliY